MRAQPCFVPVLVHAGGSLAGNESSDACATTSSPRAFVGSNKGGSETFPERARGGRPSTALRRPETSCFTRARTSPINVLPCLLRAWVSMMCWSAFSKGLGEPVRISRKRGPAIELTRCKRNAAEQAECFLGLAIWNCRSALDTKERQSTQEGGLNGQTRTEGEGHTWSWGLGFTQSVEDKQDRRRGHVAMVGQNLVRDIQGEAI